MPRIPTREDAKERASLALNNYSEIIKILKRYARKMYDAIEKNSQEMDGRTIMKRRAQALTVLKTNYNRYPVNLRDLPLNSFPGLIQELRDHRLIEDSAITPDDIPEDIKKFVIEGVKLRNERDELHKEQTKRKNAYIHGPGQASRDRGDGNVKIARQVLKQCGGIRGYDKLLRGEKKDIRIEIQDECDYSEERNVYIILKKIRDLQK